jgi:hypothetical protein
VRSLERHVLDEMADAVQAPRLVAAAGAHEDADADALQVRLGDGDDAHAVGEADDRRLRVARLGARHDVHGAIIAAGPALSRRVDRARAA